ncbi:sulfatase-like hydrolase/transferase [Paenibacillus koleovorans]|uniref:sulfatase-like hydrolase/transferase n=1 Tax=Paenibacillus koleovorans TaxID=121608 RepID=UPI000FDBE9A4|nr:sulfatase-like hydrolase/transferase [Paenibacillus koleovorans]
MSKQPNVVFIIADDHRHDAISRHGDPVVQTPALDHLIDQGISFRGTHIMGGLSPAVCMPTRASVNTGASVFRTGGAGKVNPELTLMGEWFRAHGYYTFQVGKWHNEPATHHRSFSGGAKCFFGGMSDHYQVPLHDFRADGQYEKNQIYFEDRHSTDIFTDAAIDFVQTYDREEPFLLYLAYTSPHDPRTAPEPFASRYNADNIQLPPNYIEQHPFDNGEMVIRDELLAEQPRNAAETRQHIADYYAMITHHDDALGRLFKTLKDRGLWDDTIIVYTADHGLAVGQHGLLGKQSMYDHSVRIPFLLRGPGVPAGRQFEGLTCQFDIFPTLCELSGLSIPTTVEGQSLVPTLTQQPATAPIRDSVFSLYMDIQRMVKTPRWKLIRYYRNEEKGVGTDRIQLFDLLNDPWETQDLSQQPDMAPQIEALAATMSLWQQQINDPLQQRPILV